MLRVHAPFLVLVAVSGLLLAPSPARAHCDTLSGPVVKAARSALEAKDVRPLLKWVKPDAEAEVRTAFEKALVVRAKGAEARELADRYFFETVVRVHRAGEGAPYAGLKTEADDPEGLIAASDRALDGDSPDALATVLSGHVAAGLRARYARVVDARLHADDSVAAGRRFVAAYVDYVHFVEALQNLLAGSGHAAEGGHRD